MICISDTINSADLASINFLIDDKNNQEGSLTAGKTAKKVKNNIQQFTGDALAYAEKTVKTYCDNSLIIQSYALPKFFSPMRIIRYKNGMYYGKHFDNVIQAGIRTDISFTVFLSDIDTYKGGYLRIHQDNTIQDIKLPAGSMVLYPSDSLHEITPVTSGERTVLVGWIQSYVRNPLIRNILYDLANAREMLELSKNDTQDNTLIQTKISHSYNRLYRLYCDI